MAQQDTGLGWSAKDIYLMTGTGVMASWATFGPGNLPLPYTPTEPDLKTGGLAVFERIQVPGSVTSNYITYYGVKTSGAQAIVCAVGQQLFCITNVSGVHVGEISYYTQSPDPWIYGWTDRPLSDVYGTFYYWATEVLDSNYHIDSNVPSYATVADMWAAVDFQYEHMYKLTAGPAVACVATWYDVGGSTITAPVLISSVPEYVAISNDGTSGDSRQVFSSFLLDGGRFYMSFVPGIEGVPTGINTEAPDLTQFGAAMPSKVFGLLADESFANILVLTSPDPYQQESGESEPDGGDGEDLDDDPVEEETLPVPSVAGHGFCTIYVPSSQELGQMAAYLWSGAFDVTQVIKLFSNPMDSILGLSAVPVDLVGTPEQIYLGGVALTGITMPKYTGRTSVKVDFGTATIDKRWGSYLDYEPYTEFSIYLPFIGIKPLKADDIMGKTISLMYNIDILSGGCVAYLRPAGGSVLYEWSGQCALQIPVTARNYDNVFQTAMSVVGAVGAAVVAPASAPVLSGAVASAAVQAAATKPRIERSGTVNGITGFLGQLRPYIIRTIPEAFIPADQNKFIGYPAYINVDLATVKGYNEVDSIHLENVTATGAELDEIETILKGGVIF